MPDQKQVSLAKLGFLEGIRVLEAGISDSNTYKSAMIYMAVGFEGLFGVEPNEHFDEDFRRQVRSRLDKVGYSSRDILAMKAMVDWVTSDNRIGREQIGTLKDFFRACCDAVNKTMAELRRPAA